MFSFVRGCFGIRNIYLFINNPYKIFFFLESSYSSPSIAGQALIDTGLHALGYKYVNMDCGWMGGRHPNGTLYVLQVQQLSTNFEPASLIQLHSSDLTAMLCHRYRRRTTASSTATNLQPSFQAGCERCQIGCTPAASCWGFTATEVPTTFPGTALA